ncbi:branched-chain amino acid ABC transporter permease [Actinotalea lenta]|uniref:branched-chain amino acid ABC transporter permease n=1 Tax=Actinotalea lenta TaxID=3064654 RepID=UPI00272D620A|nr:branched-chain amino acid ABC transporter permease [Isoptericola sp. b490]
MTGNGAPAALERPAKARSWGAVSGLAALTLGMVGVLWQAFSAGLGPEGNVPVFVLITLNGLTLAALYFIGASGFTLIFGLMRIPNLAHGALFLLGGYVALRLTQSGINWWFAAFVAMLATGALGLVMYLALLRWNLGQDVRQTLITIAVSVILADQMLAHFGATPEAVVPPPMLDQPVPLGLYGLAYPAFRIAVLVAALLVGAVMGLILRRTRIGIVVRAGVDDQAMTSAMGISISRVFAGAFFVGSALAGLGGAFGGTALSLAPGQDQAFLVSSLVVVIIGGMGSLNGAALGALLLGLVNQYASAYLPPAYANLSILLTFVLLAVVLAVKPTGLFGRMR